MIKLKRGNLLKSTAEALVNPVNCVGVMGAGLAYQFKKAYPKMYVSYCGQCSLRTIRIGEVTTFQENGKIIINFPTKHHWKFDALLTSVHDGLKALKIALVDKNIKSVAIPALGCGNGKLNWSDVQPLIIEELQELDRVDIELYQPGIGYT